MTSNVCNYILTSIVLYSSNRENITNSYINVTIPTHAASTFTLDGSAVTFAQVPAYPAYSYAQLSVNTGNHRLTAKEGFNAIAYGVGNYESYGYAAGANIKNRSVYIDLSNTNYEKDLGVCFGEQVSFQGKVANQVITNWKWDFGDGKTDTAQNPKHDYAKPGIYTVTMKAYKKTSNGCSSFDSSVLELAIYATPKANFSYTTGCSGDITLFSDSTKIDSGYGIQANIWTMGVGGALFGKNVSTTYTDTGWYTVTNQAVSDNNCRHTATKKIFINPKPQVKFGFENLCSGQKTYFIDSTKIDLGKITGWKWKFNVNSDSSSVQNPDYTFPQFGSNTVKLTAESDSGCFNSWDTTLSIADSIKANFKIQDTCLNKTFAFTNTSYEGSSSLTYKWEFGDDSISLDKNPKHNYINAKSHEVTLIVAQDNKCFDTIKKPVLVYPLTTGKIFYKDACLGDTTSIHNTYNIKSGFIKGYKWEVNGLQVSTDSSFKRKFVTSGKNNLSLTYTSNRGCISSIQDSVIINPPPIATLWTKGISSLCIGQSLRLVDSSKTKDTIVFSEIRFLTNKSNTKEYNFISDSVGPRVFSLNVTSKYGCKDSTKKTIFVNPGPIANFTSNESCVNVAQVFVNNTTLSAGTITKWRWTEGVRVLATVKSPSISFNSSGNKTIKLYAESNNGCKDSTVNNIDIWANPLASFEFDTTCVGTELLPVLKALPL